MTTPYLYQTIHVLDGKPRQLAEHLGVLCDWSQQILGFEWQPGERKITDAIAAQIAAERYPDDLSCFVRLTLDARGQTSLNPAGVSLYPGYAFRSLQPAAVTMRYEVPLFDAPTSAREAAAELARCRAKLAGVHVAVRCDRNGMLRTADDAPLFAVHGRTILTPPAPQSVERNLVIATLRKEDFFFDEEEIPVGALPELDELFYVDHRGIAALSRCDGNPYMSLCAERIATALEARFATL